MESKPTRITTQWRVSAGQAVGSWGRLYDKVCDVASAFERGDNAQDTNAAIKGLEQEAILVFADVDWRKQQCADNKIQRECISGIIKQAERLAIYQLS